MADDTSETSTIDRAADLTIAWLGNPNVRASAEEVPAFLKNIHATLTELAGSKSSAEGDGVVAGAAHTPAVSVRSSVKPDFLVSLIDGKPYKMLKRHLAGHGLTPAEYRQRYGLKSDYPMVAPTYAAQRRELAKRIGLGRKPRAGAPKRGRRGKAAGG